MARQVLPIVGAYFGGQLGFAIGSIIGNIVDPQKVRTPGLKEFPVMGVTEGAFRQVAYGTTVLRECQLIDWGDLDPVDVEEQKGKGGGPVVVSQRLYQTYAVGLGEPVAAIRYIKRNGVMVYDVRPGSTILAESAEFAERMRFYSGSETQLPDPDLEALPRNGVGNTPAYRGSAYFVMVRDDLTDSQGRIPTFEVEVVSLGTVPATLGGWFAGPVAVNGASGGSENYYIRADTAPELPFATPIPFPAELSGSLTRMSVANNTVFFHGSVFGAVSFDKGDTWAQCNFNLTTDYDVFWNGNFYYCGTQRSADGITWATTPNLPSGTVYVVAKTYQNIIAAVISPGGTSARISVSVDDGANWVDYPAADFFNLAISYVTPGKQEDFKFTINSTNGFSTIDAFDNISLEGFGFLKPYYSNDSDDVWIRKGSGNVLYRTTNGGSTWDNVKSIAYGGVGRANIDWGDFVWAAIREQAGTPVQNYVNYSLSDGDLGSWVEVATPIYGNVTCMVYTGEPVSEIVPAASTTLEAVVADICDRCSIPSGKLDLSELTDLLRGTTLGGNYDGADAITTLMPAFLFDLFEADRKLFAPKRGAAVKATITVDDLIDEPDENALRGQGIEYPRLLQLKYLNPGQDYAAPAATVTNKTASARVRGEVNIDLPVAFDETEALNVATRMLKVMWEDVNGEVTFSLPSGPFAWLTPSDCLGLVLRGATYRIRVEKVELSGGVMKVTARRDRQSAYTSNLTAIPLPAPKPPPPSLAGSTTFVAMNIPGRVDSDDRLGIVVAISGQPGTAWQGANIAYRIAGGTDWTSLGNFTTRAVMGELIAGLPAASADYTDTTNVLQVELIGADELETLTDTQFLSEGNPAAIVYADGTAEILQFRDAQDDGNKEWSLSYLMRGRLVTTPGPHLAGARFVMLAGSVFVPLPPALMGMDLQFRVTSIGTSPETAPVYDFTWNPVVGQTEFPAAELLLEQAGDVITASAIPRHRFGTEDAPVASLNFDGYRWTATDGSNTATNDTGPAAPTTTFDVTGWASPVTVTVALINRYTGAGPSISENI